MGKLEHTMLKEAHTTGTACASTWSSAPNPCRNVHPVQTLMPYNTSTGQRSPTGGGCAPCWRPRELRLPHVARAPSPTAHITYALPAGGTLGRGHPATHLRHLHAAARVRGSNRRIAAQLCLHGDLVAMSSSDSISDGVGVVLRQVPKLAQRAPVATPRVEEREADASVRRHG